MKRYSLVILLLFVHIFFLTNLQFTAWPEMLSYAFLRNNGFLLYKDMIHPYPPLLTMTLSYIYSVFGYGLGVLQSVAWLNILASGFLAFLVARELTKDEGKALLSLAFYVFLQPFLEGNMLWFDLAIVPPILLGTLFFLQKRHFWAGLALAAAALVKQTAGIFLIILLGFMLFKKAKWQDVRKMFVGPAILLVPLVLRLIQEGALEDFLNWTLLYPLTEWGRYPRYVQMDLTGRELAVLILVFIPLITAVLTNIVLPAGATALQAGRRKDLQDERLQLLGLFLLGALVAVYPRFSFFHFQPALALLAILFGYIWQKAEKKTVLLAATGISALVLLGMVHEPTIIRDAQKEARFYTQSDIEMARIIAEEVPEEEKVYLLGLHSGLYVMADRLPPKRWTDNFGWYLEIPGVQEEIIGRWLQNPPAAVFWQEPEPGEWYELGTYQPQKIVEWIKDNYTKEEEVKPGIWLWKLVPRRNDEG